MSMTSNTDMSDDIKSRVSTYRAEIASDDSYCHEAFREVPEQEVDERYISGACMYLAAALHRKFGWKIQVMFTNDQPRDYIEHAWVIDPSGQYTLDIDGLVPIQRSGWIHEYGTYHQDVTDAGLRELTEISSGRPLPLDVWEDQVGQAASDVERYFDANFITCWAGEDLG